MWAHYLFANFMTYMHQLYDVRDNYFKLHLHWSNVHHCGLGKIEKSLDF